MSDTAYVVTGEYVTVRTMTNDGPRIVGLYKGSAVPGDAADDWIAHHLENKLIAVQGGGTAVTAESVPEETAAPEAAAEEAEAPKSAGHPSRRPAGGAAKGG